MIFNLANFGNKILDVIMASLMSEFGLVYLIVIIASLINTVFIQIISNYLAGKSNSNF